MTNNQHMPEVSKLFLPAAPLGVHNILTTPKLL